MAKPKRPKKKPVRRKGPSREDHLAPFRCAADATCDACERPRSHHVPLCAEVDPRLVTFWASLCDACLADPVGGRTAYRNIRARGWARAGTVFENGA